MSGQDFARSAARAPADLPGPRDGLSLPGALELPNRGVGVSGAGLPGEVAFELWQAICRPAVDVTLADPADAADFAFELRTWALGELRIGTSRASAQLAARTPQLIAVSGPSQLLVQLYLEGTYCGRFGDRPVQVGPGDLVLADMGRTYESETSDFFHINMLLPRAVLHTVAPHLTGGAASLLHGHVFRAGSTAAVLMSAQIRAALELLESDAPVQPDLLRRLVLASLTAIMQEVGRPSTAPAARPDTAGGAPSPATPAALRPGAASPDKGHQLARALTEIDERLADPALDSVSLARSLAVSRTGLYRLFEPLGGVAHHIRLRRLQAALVDLTTETGVRPSVRAVARKWHFTSEGSFSRAFKAEFGVAPSDVRNQRAQRPKIETASLVTMPARPER
jgi:AraC-like DNA-binding protein